MPFYAHTSSTSSKNLSVSWTSEVVAFFASCIFEAYKRKRVLMVIGTCKVDSEELNALRRSRVARWSYRLVE